MALPPIFILDIDYFACGENCPGAPLFIGLSALITKSKFAFWDNKIYLNKLWNYFLNLKFRSK